MYMQLKTGVYCQCQIGPFYFSYNLVLQIESAINRRIKVKDIKSLTSTSPKIGLYKIDRFLPIKLIIACEFLLNNSNKQQRKSFVAGFRLLSIPGYSWKPIAGR
jgi:hypothetical protein